MTAVPERVEAAAAGPTLVPFTGARVITATWGAPSGDYHDASVPAIDVDMRTGTPIYAAGPGTVVFTRVDNRNCNPGTYPGGIQGCLKDGYEGTQVHIKHPDGTQSRYVHLSAIASGIKKGTTVKAGQRIASSGNSGTSYAPHLHYEERTSSGAYKDPGTWVACHGSKRVDYTKMQNRDGETIRNDGYGCSVGTAPKFTAATPPPVLNPGVAAAYTFKATGSPTPTYSVTSGRLPDGMTLSSAGVMSGTPTRLGASTFRVTAKNSIGSVATSTLSVVIAHVDGDGDGLPDLQSTVETDMNADGLPDLVGFGNAGVQVALNTGTGFGDSTVWIADFGYDAGWRVERHPRTIIDVNADDLPDVVGFANAGVYVALNTGTGFATASMWVPDFGWDAGWRVERHPRTIIDANADGLPDVVGFGNAAVYVALNTGAGFATGQTWYQGFTYANGGWRVEQHPRHLADLNGDGLPDIVGFSNAGVSVALNTGTEFAAATLWSPGFGYTAGGWRTTKHPRTLADVNGDGRLDVVGFGTKAVYVGLNTGSGFAESQTWATGFTYDGGGWRVERHPRRVIDINGDDRADIVGFGNAGVSVALSTGTGFAASSLWGSNFGYTAGGWRVEQHPRTVVDVNADGLPDVVGFGSAAVYVGLNTGSGITATQRWRDGFGYAIGSWRVEHHPRLIN